MPANDVEVNGTFIINSYILAYKVDGAAYKVDTLNYAAAITPLAEPTKEGYTFSGWSEIPQKMPANDVEVNGTFTVNTYLISYFVDGEIYFTDSIAYGEKITPIDEPTCVGETFSGWKGVPELMPARDVVINGTFGTNSYTITYYVDDEVYQKELYVYGSEIKNIVAPTKEGYTFSGWSEIPKTMPDNDVEIYGTFNINSYLLVYKVICEGDTSIYKSDSIVYNTQLIPESGLALQGYSWCGWSDIPTTMPAHDVEIISEFIINYYILTYTLSGEVYKKDTLVYASTIVAEHDPVKEGYTFSGWSEIPSTMPAYDVEIVGTFTINSYLLVYKVDGEVYHTDTLIYESAITAIESPTREGYTFSGWSEIPAIMPAKDIEVNGSFTVNKYLLTVIVDDVVVFSDSIAYGTRLADYIVALTQQGIDFTQWEWYDKIDNITMPAHDVTINAVPDAVHPVLMDIDESIIYDLTGKRIGTNDISILPSGIYIRNGRKFIVR